MSKPWFDSQTGCLLLDEYAANSPAFRNILADGVVTDSELAEQGRRVVSLLKELETRLPAESRDLATDALIQMAVLYAIQKHYETQQPRQA